MVIMTLSKILCKWKQDSVISSFLYLDSVFKHKDKLVHNILAFLYTSTNLFTTSTSAGSQSTEPSSSRLSQAAFSCSFSTR